MICIWTFTVTFSDFYGHSQPKLLAVRCEDLSCVNAGRQSWASHSYYLPSLFLFLFI